MKNNISLKSIGSQFSHFLSRYHFILFVIIVLGGLAIAIFLLNNTLNVSAADAGYKNESNLVKFDNDTIQQLNRLKTIDEQTELKFPAGRSNPFVE